MTAFFKHPVWAMAFRPFYSLAALYGALSILLWGFGYTGTPELHDFYWHAHEMIWGYAGLVVIAFLLTAVATMDGAFVQQLQNGGIDFVYRIAVRQQLFFQLGGHGRSLFPVS